MKKITTGALLIFLIVFIAQPFQSHGQSDYDQLLKGSLTDASYLLEGYIAPAMNSIGNGLNQGWYNTAKTHKPFGVDLTITTSLIYIPGSDNFYTVDNTRLQEIRLLSYDGQSVDASGSGSVPTIFGPEKSPLYEIQDSGKDFEGPPGFDLENTLKIASALPVPMYHLGIGLPKNFDLKIRFSPTVEFSDFRFNLLGLGLMHDIKQYIPGIKVVPIDLAIFAGYTQMKMEQGLSGTTPAAGADQKAIAEFKATTVQALISKKISVLTVYGAVGYNFANSSLDMKGTYDLDDDGTPDVTDPLSLDFSTSGPRATAGIRLKLAVITLHADYTLANYNALSVGFGINIR
jgi:hypothetical protein